MKPKILAIVAISCISLFLSIGCTTPKSTAVRMDDQSKDNFWRIDGPTWEDCWMKLRYVMDEQKASGFMVWSNSDDKQGHHMLVRLQILE